MLSKRQKELRRSAVGASEVACLAGLSKWASPIQIYEAKVSGVELESSYAMELGIEMEQPIARVWARQHGKVVRPVDTLRHPSARFAIATPDRAIFSVEAGGDYHSRQLLSRDQLATAEALLQVKSSNWRMKSEWGEQGTDEIPTDYLCQAHWEGSVAGLSTVRFAVDFDKTQLFEYEVQVSAEAFERLYEVASRFMVDHVLARVPPPPDASDQFHEYLGRAFPREETAGLIDTSEDPEFEAIVAQFLMLRVAEKRVKDWKTWAYQRIATRIAGATGLIGSWGKITWKRTKDSVSVDWKARAEQAELMARLVLNGLQETTTGVRWQGTVEQRADLVRQLDGLAAATTTTKPGHRTMRAYPAGQFTFDGPEGPVTINLALEGFEPTKANDSTTPTTDAQEERT